MTRQVAVVPHTHWDREWYEAFPVYRSRLVEVVDGLVDLLEADPALRSFLLDGQMALVDDYLAVRPESGERLASLVRSGRVSVGPWYALMDEFLVSGETIVRNLQMGMARASAFGGHLPVGYLPDMFGHVGQMPQLLRAAGLSDAVVWRGVPSAVDRSGFWWRAPDGSTVRAEYLPTGYGNGASVPDDPDALLRRLRAYEHQVAAFLASGSPILLMQGTDHQAPQPWLPEVIAKVNVAQDDFALSITGLAEYLADAPTDGLPEWTGELRSSAGANLLMGVASNRVDVKIAAARTEWALERRAEPLAALWLAGQDWVDPVLDRAWLQVVRNSAHDSICACSADEVGRTVLHRFGDAAAAARSVAAAALARMPAQLSVAGPVVVNPDPIERRGLVEVVLPGSVPPAGTQLLGTSHAGTVERLGAGRDLARLLGELTGAGWLLDGSGTTAEVTWSPEGVELGIVVDEAVAGDRSLRPVGPAMAEAAAQAGANPDLPLRVRVERRPSVRVLARTGPVPGFGWAPLDVAGGGESDGTPVQAVLGGDNWLDNGLVHLAVNPADGTFAVNGLAGMGRLVDDGDDGDTYNYSPPAGDLAVSRPDGVSVALVEDGPLRGCLVVQRRYTWPLRIEQGRRVGATPVEVTTTLDLRAGEKLVRVTTAFDNPARDHRVRAWFPLAARAEHSEAECAFGIARRGLTAESGPGEDGLPTFPSRRWVRAGGVTVTHEGLHEYEVVEDGWALALTLLRATGVISKPVLPVRRNAAGPATPVPDAQLVGPLTFRYAVAVGDCDPWSIARDAWSPLELVRGTGSGPLPPTGSHLEVLGAEVSSLRRRGRQLELRVFNPSDRATVVSVGGRGGWLVDLTGRPIEPWTGSFPLRPWGIATTLVDPQE